MKKAITLTFVLFCANYVIQAQVQDTTIYLKQIETIKANYIGKTFSELEKDLKIKIVYFSPMLGIFSDKSKETSTRFYFLVPESMEDFGVNCIEVYWNPYLNANISSQIFDDAPDNGNWVNAAREFYKNGIIKNIRAR